MLVIIRRKIAKSLLHTGNTFIQESSFHSFPLCLITQSSSLHVKRNFANMTLEKPAQMAVQIFAEAVESVKPKHLLRKKLKLENGTVLKIEDGNKTFTIVDLSNFNKIHVVGFGKAVLPMAEQIKTFLGDRISKCIVNIPVGFRDPVVPGIKVNRGAKNNIPDEASFEGSREIVQLVKDCDPNDLLIVLITGGGSALLSYPLHSIAITDSANLVKTLSRAGATIQELNSVRKRLSLVKGGGLLGLCKSEKIISLILSDVLGDPLDIIASGPTVTNPDPDSHAREIIDKYLDFQTLSPGIKQALSNPKLRPISKDVSNIIIGSNTIALEAAAETARNLNLYTVILTTTLDGDAAEIGKCLGEFTQAISHLLRSFKLDQSSNEYSSLVIKIVKELNLDEEKLQSFVKNLKNPNFLLEYFGVCVLLGGETTVKVRGSGVGGRNQELALSAGLQMEKCSDEPHIKGKVALLSAGTDGYDGPCDAAGAVIDSNTIKRGKEEKLRASEFLGDNDSYNYFKSNSDGIYHILTDHTETNVMDLICIVATK